MEQVELLCDRKSIASVIDELLVKDKLVKEKGNILFDAFYAKIEDNVIKVLQFSKGCRSGAYHEFDLVTVEYKDKITLMSKHAATPIFWCERLEMLSKFIGTFQSEKITITFGEHVIVSESGHQKAFKNVVEGYLESELKWPMRYFELMKSRTFEKNGVMTFDDDIYLMNFKFMLSEVKMVIDDAEKMGVGVYPFIIKKDGALVSFVADKSGGLFVKRTIAISEPLGCDDIYKTRFGEGFGGIMKNVPYSIAKMHLSDSDDSAFAIITMEGTKSVYMIGKVKFDDDKDFNKLTNIEKQKIVELTEQKYFAGEYESEEPIEESGEEVPEGFEDVPEEKTEEVEEDDDEEETENEEDL